MKSITALASLVGFTIGAGDPFGYASNGVEWGTLPGFEECAKKGGSPINLATDFSTYRKYDYTKDEMSTAFTNQRNVIVKWTGTTSQVALTTSPNSFLSTIGQTIFGAHTKEWDAAQFYFRHKSEHKINGNPFDLEMQTIFDANPKQDTDQFKAAAVGILFSVNDFNIKLSKAEQLVIDTFFETLDWGYIDPTPDVHPNVNLVTYGDLMNMVDFKNRWVYKGSMTEPPCEQSVYWNVLQTIYPIKKKHLDLFKKQLARGQDGQLATFGNWRVMQTSEPDEHQTAVVTETTLGSEKDTANDINYNVNINIYNQNVGGQGQCS